jgi:prepilin-type N-terminal cleavage/methylation domain-containing protein
MKLFQLQNIKNNQGFTLIELMIVIFILSTLTVITAQSIQQAVKSKVKRQALTAHPSR